MAAMRAHPNPYARLNLRRNPFGSVPLDRWHEVALVDVARFAERLARPGYAVQFRGDCGRGKSTHMRALHAHFSDAPFVYFPPDGSKPAVPRAERLFLDEAQRMSWLHRERVFRRTSSLAIATHGDHAGQLRRLGFQVETVEVGGLDLPRLRAIVDRRIGWASTGEPAVRIEDARLAELIAAHGDDLRAIESELYEQVQRRIEEQPE